MGIQIDIQNLHKTFVKGGNTIEILKGVSMQIPAAAQIAITGVSGAGKSTLLHILGTLDKPSQGQVLFDGTDVFKASDEELASMRNQKIGFVFQFHHLLEEFKAIENVAMPLFIQGIQFNDALEQASEVLEWVGLGHRKTHLPAQLSGGEQQRVAIARSLVTKPALLLMDEPTGNLDEKTAESVHALIADVTQKIQTTLIVVTHNPYLAEQMPTQYHIADGLLSS